MKETRLAPRARTRAGKRPTWTWGPKSMNSMGSDPEGTAGGLEHVAWAGGQAGRQAGKQRTQPLA